MDRKKGTSFWARVLEARPNLECVYFSPTKKTHLRCRPNADGTVSPEMALDRRFKTATSLAAAWKSGEIVSKDGRKFPSSCKPASMFFQKDFFLEPGRKSRVSSLLQKEGQRSRTDASTNKNPSSTAGNKIACPGFLQAPHDETIRERQWNSARSLLSPVVLDGDRCRSKRCLEFILPNGKMCEACKKANRQLISTRCRYNKKPVSEESRIMRSSMRWLSETDFRKKIRYMLNSNWKTSDEDRKKDRSLIDSEKVLENYRPKCEKNRKAVPSIGQKLDDVDETVEQFVCNWNVCGNVCGHRAASIDFLHHHVKEAHLVPQIDTNSSMQPTRRRFAFVDPVTVENPATWLH